MAELDFFLGPWEIHSATGHARIRRAFPTGVTLTIERVGRGPGCHVFWKDADGTEHDLANIVHDGGRLIGRPARDEPNDLDWLVTISASETGKGITGAVRQYDTIAGEEDDHGESNLAGVWGAEAPPPIRSDEPRGSSA